MFKNCRKEDLRIVALELGETVAEKVTIVELTEIIKENKYFKEDVEFVKELIQYTIEDRKRAEEDRKKEAENRLREKELELELARLNVNSDNERTGEGCNTLDALVKSVRILTVKVPNRLEERVQMLLGAEVFYELMLPGQFKTEGSNVIFQNTVFGFIVSGSTSSDAKGKEHCGFIQAADNLEHSIKKFWEIENVEIDSVKTSELDICEDHFKSTHSRDDQGRYTVAMPLKEDPSCLGESRQTAIQRLNSLWKRLSRDKEYLSLYEKFLQEYEDLGHMREIKADGSGVSFYMPHHGVYRPEKSTTKMRTVFNASSPSTSGKSLNSIQFNGGLVQEDLFSIMVRFRKHKYAFTTDIEKMFRMINIHPEQTCLQRILWKKGIGEPIKTYELTTVTYGTVSAPYLATRTLKQLAMDEANNFPLAAPVLLSDCYMDDILSGSESIEEVIELQHQLIEMFKTAGMQLHKWCGNLPEITTNLQEYAFLESEETKALGMIWNPKLDCFLFRIEQQRPTSFTKRMVLSTIARIFDPLGLLGPIITWAKIFMQRLWLLELGWSDELPFKEQKEWRRFIDSLKAVNNISIDRCIVIHRAESIELHAFSDASEKAYGSSIYLKSISALGEVKVCLVTSKSRVSPLKQISIPRLELCGAVLAAKLMKKVKEALNLQITAVHFWSDSTIVISWIHRESRELKTFVANRVSKIHQLSSRDQWHHIASEQNRADVLSRGLLPEELRDDSLWWHGPELLQSTYSTTVIAEPTQRDGFDCELRVSERTLETSLLSSKNFDFFNHLMDLSNNYFKIIHIVSYIYRFIENCRSKVKKRGPLTTSEVNDAETWLIKQDQSGINLSDPSGNLKSLNIFQDDKGILRVGGRLEKASIPYSQKHPAILAKNSKLSKIYFITLHKKLFHVGPQGLLNAVRLRFWALGGRNLARKTVHTCVVCFKCKPIPSSQIMGNLPYERVNMAPPFSITGLDLGGPYFVTYKHQRKGVLNKIYVCVCICFVTRAIHLEILSDLTSDAIIATLKRFMSRRGKCSKIFTDNATNFVGANSQLKVFYKTLNFPDQNLAAYFTEEGIEWNFIPPRAPHMGGLWEAGIKSVKYHLKQALGRSRLTYEEFETVIIQVEGILNSRPLTPISNDFDNFEIKTLAENNKGNSSSLEKMEYRLSEYSPTERKVDDREGQCNVWYNGSDAAFNEMLFDAWELANEIDVPANFGLTQPRRRVREVLGPVDPRDVIYTKTRIRTPSTDQSSRRQPHIVKSARVQPTASSDANQASLGALCLLEPYEGTWVKDICDCGAHYGGCPRRPPIDASVWSGAAHEETGLQRNGTRSSLATNPDSISAVMTIWFVSGDPVVNASILPLLYSNTPLPQLV
ncbi:integrase catalytic domain-containing protein [Trichonephila clavipes]|nr:integrase catalytic domain-containing protein [Trichonephila clavipes]